MDIDSPIRKRDETCEERGARSALWQDIENEFNSFYSRLNKRKGGDVARRREKAAAKLMTEEEMAEVYNKKTESLKRSLKEDYCKFDKNRIALIRDDLISCAAIRLGRRSTELKTMTVEEVERAEERFIDGEANYIIKVLTQKDLRTGKKAPVVFTSDEYTVLDKYIKILRPKLNIQKDCNTVFTTVKKNSNCQMSLASIWKILQSCETSSGKKMSSRAIRGSKVTNTRYKNLTNQEMRDHATSMSHSIATQDRYYDYKHLSDSVVNTLSNQPSTSTPKKSRTLSASENSVSSADETLINLRSKKIKVPKRK